MLALSSIWQYVMICDANRGNAHAWVPTCSIYGRFQQPTHPCSLTHEHNTLNQCCVNSIHIENTEIEHFEYRDFSVMESFQVQVFRYEGLGILGILGFYTISKPKINLKPTFNDNLCLKTIYQTLISELSKCLNRKIENCPIRIEIGIIEAEIRIEATQPTRRMVTALL